MTRLMLILSALAAVLLIASPAALACENCGCQKAKAEKTTKAKDCPKDCDCADCKAKAADGKKDKACPPGCDCPACKAKAAKASKDEAGCGCAHKGSHPDCPHAKKKTK